MYHMVIHSYLLDNDSQSNDQYNYMFLLQYTLHHVDMKDYK